MALDTLLQLQLTAKLTTTKDLGVTPESVLPIFERIHLATGTGAGKADKLWYDERTLAASATEDLDLVGTLTDDFGVTFSPTKIKALWIKAASADPLVVANTNDVIVGAASATQWAALLGTTGTLRLRPGAQIMLAAGKADATGYVCAAGATDLLKVANSAAGTQVIYQIAIVGATA
jgi:hypothetical protein